MADTPVVPVVVPPVVVPPVIDPKVVVPPIVDSKKWKIKVMGKEVEADEATLLKMAEKGEGADRALAEASRLRKETERDRLTSESLLAKLKSDPKGFIRQLDQLGIKHQDIIKDMVYEAIEEQRLTPEEKDTRGKLAKLKQLEEEKSRQEEQAKEAAFNSEVQTNMARLAQEIDAAIDKVGLPKNKEIRSRTAYYMAYAKERGAELTTDQAAEFAKKSYMSELKNLVASLPEDRMSEFVSDDLLNKIRKMDIAKSKITKKDDTPVKRLPVKDAPKKTIGELMSEKGF